MGRALHFGLPGCQLCAVVKDLPNFRDKRTNQHLNLHGNYVLGLVQLLDLRQGVQGINAHVQINCKIH